MFFFVILIVTLCCYRAFQETCFTVLCEQLQQSKQSIPLLHHLLQHPEGQTKHKEEGRVEQTRRRGGIVSDACRRGNNCGVTASPRGNHPSNGKVVPHLHNHYHSDRKSLRETINVVLRDPKKTEREKKRVEVS